MEIFIATLLGVLLNLLKIAILIFVALITVFSPPLLGALYTTLVFYPYKEPLTPVSIDGCRCLPVTFQGQNGTTLTGWYFKNPLANRIIMVSHGNTGHMAHRARLAEHLYRTGCSVFMYDYAGYGTSTGSPSPEVVLEDGISAYNYVHDNLQYRPDQIILYGESLGCAVSSYVTSHKPAGGLILQSGFKSLPDIAKEKFAPFRLFPNAMFYKPHMSNIDVLKAPHPPLLIMHGVRDLVIPFRHAVELSQQASQPVKLVPLTSSGHNDILAADSELFDKALNDFVKSLPPITNTTTAQP